MSATWPAQPLSDEEFEAMLRAMSAFAERGQRYVILYDARRAARPTPTQRAAAAAQQKRDADKTSRLCAGIALRRSRRRSSRRCRTPRPGPARSSHATADRRARF